MSQFSRAAAGKRVELLREMLPNLRHLAVLASTGITALEIREIETAARTLELDLGNKLSKTGRCAYLMAMVTSPVRCYRACVGSRVFRNFDLR